MTEPTEDAVAAAREAAWRDYWLGRTPERGISHVETFSFAWEAGYTAGRESRDAEVARLVDSLRLIQRHLHVAMKHGVSFNGEILAEVTRALEGATAEPAPGLFEAAIRVNERSKVSAALFQPGRFTMHSGAESYWKIECDALTEEDWRGLAIMAQEVVAPYDHAIGVPRGGLPFADALNYVHESGDGVLVVDDVLTTGASILEVMAQHPGSRGLVAFARGPLPPNVSALWVRPEVSAAPESALSLPIYASLPEPTGDAVAAARTRFIYDADAGAGRVLLSRNADAFEAAIRADERSKVRAMVGELTRHFEGSHQEEPICFFCGCDPVFVDDAEDSDEWFSYFDHTADCSWVAARVWLAERAAWGGEAQS